MTATASGTATAGQYENIATVTATVSGGGPVSDSDISHYFGSTTEGSIDIEKATNGHDADSAPGPNIAVGDPVTWTYVVTNTGSVALSDINIVDDILGSITTVSTLAPGASMTATASDDSHGERYSHCRPV
jgi:uncharacterized repeat protein (TIGR01451 family)